MFMFFPLHWHVVNEKLLNNPGNSYLFDSVSLIELQIVLLYVVLSGKYGETIVCE